MPSVELRSDENVKSFDALDGGTELICASTDRFVLLHKVKWEEMLALANEFATALDTAMIDYFLRPSGTIRKGQPAGGKAKRSIKIANAKSPEALAVGFIGTPKSGFTQVQGFHCNMSALKGALQAHDLLERYKTLPHAMTPEWHVVYESYELQRSVVQTMISSTIRTMEWSLPSSNLCWAASERVLELAATSKNTEEFLSRVCDPLVEWLGDVIRKGAEGSDSRDVHRPLALMWFAIWLAERKFLLFPLNSVFGRSAEFLPLRYRYFLDDWIRPKDSTQAASALHNRLKSAFTRVSRVRDQSHLHIWTLNLVTPGLAWGRIAAGCLAHLKASLRANAEETHLISLLWKLEALRLKAENYDPSALQLLTDQVIRRKHHVPDVTGELWPWIEDPHAKLGTRTHYVRSNVRAGSNLLAHVSELRELFPAVAGKSGRKVSTRLSIWLFFLSGLKDELVPRVVDIRPQMLESVRDKKDTATLRGFMASQSVPDQEQRGVYSTLKKVWIAAAHFAGVDGLLCPVSDHIVSRPTRGVEKRPSFTTRRSLDMEILELLIAENQAQDFIFSRTRAHATKGKLLDWRLVTDPMTGALQPIWWPGNAVLMDLLLQIPLRHKQGRFLDSGEGDELLLNIDTLQYGSNPLPTAERGRNQAFIQRISLSPLHDEPGLGMFVNTNKTGVDYAFPWLRTEIALNVQRVVDWQKQYNPIQAPVSDRDDTKEERASGVEPTMVYPIFRDPDRHNHGPVSKPILLDYFRALLLHVEEKYNLANNTSISFFRPNGEALFDIHSLRVTGVTRLLSMGVDPKIVRLLVGHASLTMTFYYEHLTNERISRAIESALEARKPSREALLNMSPADREEFLSRLFNRSDSPSLGLSMLHSLIDDRSPFLDLRVDGICPGIRCSDAGVWRTRACSLCKFNVTGVPFLAGLELVLNDLMAELILYQSKLTELREQLFKKRSERLATRALEAEIAKCEEFVDNLLQQWEAQFHYVKKAEGDLGSWLTSEQPTKDSEARMEIALLSPDAHAMALSLQETHHLALFTRLIEASKCVEGFLPTVGTREKRDEMLLEIARHECKAELFYRLEPKLRRAALDQFALLLLEQDLPSERISALIGGSTKLSEFSQAAAWLQRLEISEDGHLLATGVE